MDEDRQAADRQHDAPLAVLEATRSLFRIETSADARRITAELIRRLGGTLVPAGTDDASVLPGDVSFGDGVSVLPAAPPGSAARAQLDRHLAPFLLDARRALELSRRATQLAESASTDVLTGLPNRRMIERALGRLSGNDTVIMVDLDHFKAVNDGYGHATGDEVLRAFGSVLLSSARGRDIVGRYGGEEFVVILGPPADADAFLQRLRTRWVQQQPLPVSFSAGIARSVGDPDETMSLADEALYRAKDAGRDQWTWATGRLPQSDQVPRDHVRPYLDNAVHGRRQPAIRIAIDLLDNRVPREQIVVELLAVAQREVGDRWHRNELTAADEHLATGVAAAALDALSSETAQSEREGPTVVTCAEGDWHSLAAQMIGVSLREHGVGVAVLGASTPATVVAEFLARSGGDSLAISCSLPIFFSGAVRLVDAAHRQGIPVIVGGRAFGSDPSRARQLGADAWALTAAEAAPILAGWRREPPSVTAEPTRLDPGGIRLAAAAEALGGAALDGLRVLFPPMAGYDERRLARTREDLVFIVQFLAAARLAADHTVFSEFLNWLQDLLGHRDVPPRALITGLEALRPVVEAVDAGALAMLDRGRQGLVDALH
jgi:diguanylate cyclase (GGDEF)-like protein